MKTSTPSSAPSAEAVLNWARDLYSKGVDEKDAAAFAAAFTENGTLRFGNNETIRGRAAIEAAIGHFFTTFQTLRHKSVGEWFHQNTLFLEAIVAYRRHDEREVSIPAITIFHLAGADLEDSAGLLADDCRIYVDLTPLYAPASP